MLVQILILKGGLNQARLRKKTRNRREGGEEKELLRGGRSSSVVYLAINVLDWRKKSSVETMEQ